MFIAFEGIDGSGKSTQARLLYERMLKDNKDVLLTAEPTDGKIGDIMKVLIQGQSVSVDPATLQLLFIADRSDHVHKVIGPSLKVSRTVITDRYLISTIAYGMSFNLNESWLSNVNGIFPYPDYNFIIDVDPEIALKRVSNRSNSKTYFEKKDFLERIRENYKILASKNRNCFIIDGDKSEEQISDIINSILNK